MSRVRGLLAVAFAGGLGVATTATQAALVNGSVLSFSGTFGLEVSPGLVLLTNISSFNGLIIGVSQLASGSHSGAPDGSESPDIDNPWLLFGNTGMHQITSPVTIMSDDGVGNVTLDFSGWNVTYNAIPGIPMGGGAWQGNPDGVAIVTCANTCEGGDTFILDYSAIVPVGEPGAFVVTPYNLHLNGTVAAPVPLPAAFWLFGAGLGAFCCAVRSKRQP